MNCREFPDDPQCIEACMADPSQPVCMRDGGTDGGLDANDASDVGPDAPDVAACPTACEGTTPFCDATRGECVACRTGDDCDTATPFCVEAADGPTCVACGADTDCDADAPRCEDGACVGCDGTDPLCARFSATPLCGGGGDCVACNAAVQCTEVGMARCDLTSGTCAPCTAEPDCEGTGQNTCVAGTCVECTETSAPTHCGDFSCNPATNTCTTTERDSVPDCGRCVSDEECMGAEDRCVPMNFMGATRPSGHCLRMASAGCARPYLSPVVDESLSGEPEMTYCGVDQNSTTCDAMRALRTSTPCPSGMASACADAGAVCAMVGLEPEPHCSIPCGAPSQCPTGFACTTTYCGS